MVESFLIQKMVDDIENRYIGFSPNTSSVKPAHIANGLFRAAYGSTYSARMLNEFVFSETDKGVVPPGRDFMTIYQVLQSKNRLESHDIKPTDLPTFRRLLKKIVGADSAVFKDSMASYSAGHHLFLTRDSIAQDAGEFVAACLRQGQSALYEYLRVALQDRNDIITLLCSPLLPLTDNEEDSGKQVSTVDEDPQYGFLSEVGYLSLASELSTTGQMWQGMLTASNTLAEHLEKHPNKLFGMRLVTMFACFIILRHLTSLEAYFVPDALGRIPSFLLDFSASAREPIAKASLQTYVRCTQSIIRFYSWAIGEKLQEQVEDENELYSLSAPVYKIQSDKNKNSQKVIREAREAAEIWEIAGIRAQEEGDAFRVFGEAVYDMLSTQASSDPIKYFRALGLRSGILYPPNQNIHRFAIRQDVLEMLVRGAVRPGESIDMLQLQERFWDRYRIIVGGRLQDEQALYEMGVYQFDRNSLLENRNRFAEALTQLDFASMLADGVLQVGL